MKTHLFIGGGQFPSERTKKVMDMMEEAGYAVEYRQLSTSTTESESQPTIIIWDEMVNMDFGDLEARYEHSVIFGSADQIPPFRNFDGIHPCEVERVIPKNTQGMGPRNKWGKLK